MAYAHFYYRVGEKKIQKLDVTENNFHLVSNPQKKSSVTKHNLASIRIINSIDKRQQATAAG